MISNSLKRLMKVMSVNYRTRLVISKMAKMSSMTVYDALKTLINLNLVEHSDASKKPIYYRLTYRGVKMQEALE